MADKEILEKLAEHLADNEEDLVKCAEEVFEKLSEEEQTVLGVAMTKVAEQTAAAAAVESFMLGYIVKEAEAEGQIELLEELAKFAENDPEAFVEFVTKLAEAVEGEADKDEESGEYSLEDVIKALKELQENEEK